MSDVENDTGELLDIDNRRSSRRRESSRKQGQKSALEQLKESRRTGRGHRVNVDDLHKDVYSIVDEEEFSKIRKQRQDEDFVVDDDGGGYVDHGEDFDEEDDDDCEDDYVDRKRDKKKKKDKKESKRGAMDGFLVATSSNRSKVKDESKINLDGDEMLLNLLASMDDKNLEPDYESPTMSSPSFANVNPFARGGTKRAAAEDVITPRPVTKRVKRLITTTPASSKASPSIPQRSNKIVEREEFSYSPLTAPKGVAEVKEEKIEDDDEFETPARFHDEIDVPLPVQVVKLEDDQKEKGAKTLTFAFVDDVAAPDDEARDNKDELLDVAVVAGSEQFYVTAEDGTRQIRVYFIDAFEDPVKHNGTVYLFGRVLTSLGKSASCCVVVKNIHRQVFFLPRAKEFNNESGPKLHEEVKKVMHDHVLFKLPLDQRKFRCKPASKKFMNNGTLEDTENCEERPVLEVQYPSTFSRLPLDLTGDHFSGVFNTTTTAMERLLVELQIMGPGWLDVSNYEPASAKQSYCDYEFSVDMERMKNIKYDSECRSPPPLAKLLSLNVLTTLNGKENQICMITAIYNNKCNILNPNAANAVRYCLITKPSNGVMPYDMKNQIASINKKDLFKVIEMNNEKAMLTKFLTLMRDEWEPDIYVGHDLQATMDLLKSRLQKLKIPLWSCTSRLRRTVDLSTIKNNKAGQWEFTAGRLLVDSRLAAMELVRSRSFDLTELVKVILNAERTDLYANEIGNYYSNSKQLLNLVDWSWNDSLLTMRIIMQLNALPLFLTITNIVGGVTSRTLMGGRAERNEFLLLHAFHRGNVIAPEKHQPTFNKKETKTSKKTTVAVDGGESQNEPEHDGGEDDNNAPKNKAQYAGGLVLEPKKGLYETLILLLDFNSLYPSIIQEYNICFTTVKHTKDSNELPEPPQDGTVDGILPCEIRGLVERRRAVKRLMKDTPDVGKRKMYDIRQMALKLTANSMYGCLGFVQSRFYAKPLAALITSKGREILMHSKDLVEKMGYSVIYGDTDSIMINTNSTDLQVAKKLGYEIKTHVNKCHKLLELDLDGVFKRMLLLKKKKYAALTVNPDNENETKKELKGLDIVRRDWSQLAKHAGNDVVDLILDPKLTREELVAEIHDTLRTLREKLDEGKIETKLFEISKQLTRNPKEYADLKSQAHAAVATRLNESGRFTLKQGDIVEYIICEDGTTNSATQRAYHRSELELNNSLKIDLNYYLAQQVHPVVSRLCAPIEETDAVRIAEALGMDSAGFRRAAAARAADCGSGEDELAWQGPLSYDHCEGFKISCPARCGKTVIVRDFVNTEATSSGFSLETCPQCNCVLSDYASFLINQLDNQLAEYVQKHASAPFKCDDQVCSYRMVSHPLKWSREGLECSKCTGGVLRKEYTSKELYDQQIFLKQIVNVNHPDLKAELKSALEKKTSLVNMCRRLSATVDIYLQKNSYNRVDLSFIFAPMLKL